MENLIITITSTCRGGVAAVVEKGEDLLIYIKVLVDY